MAFNHTNNYSLGKGELYFARQNTDGTYQAERYLGNTPEFALTIQEEKLEHFNSDRGVKEKDASVTLQTNRTGSFTTDDISPENIALFFFGDSSVVSVTGATVTDEAITASKDRYIQLGETSLNPSGNKALIQHSTGVNVVVTNSAGTTTYAEGTDYEVSMTDGRLYIKSTGAITEGQALKVDYKYATSTRTRILSGTQAIKGKMRFISANHNGTQMDYTMPSVTLAPNGDFALKGDTWQQLSFNIEVLKPSDKEAIYVETRAVTA